MLLLMGIDLGTSSVKVCIMDLHGNVVATGQEVYDILTPRHGYAEQDIELLWIATVKAIKHAMFIGNIDPVDIRSIGLSGQMHGLVLIDKQMRPVRPAIIWADQRTKQQVEDIYGIVGKDKFKETTLNSLGTGFFICSLMWIKCNEPENYAKSYRAILPKDYIRYRLCGELGTDVTDASSTQAFDTAKRSWAFDIIEKIGINRELFPTCGEAYHIAGEITQEACEETGLRRRTPVVYGGGDTLMHSVGNGMIKPGLVSANIGTAAQLLCTAGFPAHDAKFRTNTFCHVKEDLWVILGGHLNGGMVLEWLRDKCFPHLSYKEFDSMAEGLPAGSEGMLFLPYLAGERTPYHDPNAKGIFFGMTLRHGCNHMIRSVMEGVIMSLRLSLDIFRELHIPIESIIASGGGAKSHAWLQMQADIFNTEILTVTGGEEACKGAAITAGLGAGFYTSYDQACQAVVRYDPRTVIPNGENVRIYDEAFEKFKLLYSNNKNLFIEGYDKK